MSESMMIRRLAWATVAFSMIGVGAACNSDSSDSSTTSQPSVTTSSTTNATAPLTGFLETQDGAKGSVTYKAELPQLKGGDAVVRDAFNGAMRTALDDYLKPNEDNLSVTVAPGVLNEDDRSEVAHIGTGAVAGVLLLNIFVDHAAHPFNVVATTVIDAHTAKPIMITDLFTDPTAGLTALVDGIKSEIAADEKLAGQPAPEPVADQLANWVPDDDGLVVYLPVAHVLGDYYPVTVDWDALSGVLAPGMREKLTT
ncbi:hypothetical protein A5699_12150 [Mycobacterium sp. E802]|uniref:RsiV family protein n=1 Tax=Mycobacterium sp. E802 TaxID=1834152 RepID=UPI0007FD3B87|nr:RsiV family protein [Mycobacterium sp. E802]OBG79958.1 hypothetical protein A5699_12150 [Mycobacterium sp. E802]